MFDSVRWSGQRRSSPTFGRGWWIAEAETEDRVRRNVLGALDDHFVFVERGGGDVLDSDALVNAVEKATLI